MKKFAIVASALLLCSTPSAQQQRPATPARPAGQQEESIRPASPRGAESKGPFKTLVVRNAMLIDGTGAAARGPMPSLRRRTMFSSTTMASSTTRPVASTKASSVRMLSEKPAR